MLSVLLFLFAFLLPEEPQTSTITLRVPDGVHAAQSVAHDDGFRFVRIRYNGRTRWGNPSWRYDWPSAELNLHEALSLTTSIELEGEPIVLSLKDPEIFDYPMLYLCEPGYWEADDEEVAALRTYLLRGGFILIDDFHDYGDGQVGPEWENFYSIIERVFPDREMVNLDPDHPIWSIYYDVDPVEARSTKWQSGEVPWLDIDDDTYLGIFDDNGRLMVLICYNQDIGDGWEWPSGRNLGEASTVSFQMAINFILYILTH